MLPWFEKITAFMKDKKGRKGIENLVIILILGVIIIIVAGSFFSEDKNKNNMPTTQEKIALPSDEAKDELQMLEERLERILSEIEGAGEVKVMITGVSDGEVVHAYNQVEESSLREEHNGADNADTTDELRREQELVFMEGSSGERIPVVIKSYQPEIKGVVVVADGAGNSMVQQDITGAVEALMGIPPHKIRVLKRK